jgi:non-heme chloroperoxidase
VIHSEDDQIVPYEDSGPRAAKLLPNGTLKTYKDLPHGSHATHPDLINADFLAFIRGEPVGEHRATAPATGEPALAE